MTANKRLWIGSAIIAMVLCAGLLVAQAPAARQAAPQLPGQGPVQVQDPGFTITGGVTLVNVTATVLDEKGSYVDGLKQEDFQVFEDGTEQKISFFSHDRRIPVSVGVLVDISGSMRHKLQQALQTARELSLALSPQDEMFLITFNTDVDVRQHLTNNPLLIERSLQGIRTSGDTSVYDALQAGLVEMKSAKNSKKIMVLVSDGFDSRSKLTLSQTEENLKRAETEVYAIGIDDDENDPQVVVQPLYHIYHYMLNDIATISGGRVFRLFTGRSYALDGLAKVLMEELHQQYLLSYYPAPGGGTGFRSLDVKVAQPRAEVRHRTGYYPTQSTPASR
ncbi:MAG TPA: VWA domain-containing protein [Terriglobia bacterium]|nr:VWA domain-containing protein [Terriglobia bacterium]